MRGRLRRPFTIEVKSSARRRETSIPSRIARPVAPSPHAFRSLPAKPPASGAEPRRVLPSLIEPEPLVAEPDVMAAEAHAPPRKRRRRRKAKVASEPVIEPAAPRLTPHSPSLRRTQTATTDRLWRSARPRPVQALRWPPASGGSDGLGAGAADP